MSFLFGNISKDGLIDNEDMDDEMKQVLEMSSGVLTQLIGSDQMSLLKEDDDFSRKKSKRKLVDDEESMDEIKPLPTAIDFNEEDDDEEEDGLGDSTGEQSPEEHTINIQQQQQIQGKTLLQQQQIFLQQGQQQQFQQQSFSFHPQQQASNIIQFNQMVWNRMFAQMNPNQLKSFQESHSKIFDEQGSKLQKVKQIFPFFEKDKILKFSELITNGISLQMNPDEIAMTAAQKKILAKKRDLQWSKLQNKQPSALTDERVLFESDQKLPDKEDDSDPNAFNDYRVNKRINYVSYSRILSNIKNKMDNDNRSVTIKSSFKLNQDSTPSKSLSASVDDDSLFHPIHITSWEENIIWDDEESLNEFLKRRSQVQRLTFSVIPDYDLNIGNWENDILWDEEYASAYTSCQRVTEIPMNDPHLIIDIIYPSSSKGNDYEFPEHFHKASAAVSSTTHAAAMLAQKSTSLFQMNKVSKRGRPATQSSSHIPSLIIQPQFQQQEKEKQERQERKEKELLVLDEFNLSNDRYYELQKHVGSKTGRVRQLLGKVAPIQHLLPATRLSLPYYRRFMSKQEMRIWHRPQIKLQYSGPEMKFTKMKNMIKKNIKMLQKKKVSMHDLVQNVTDITLADNGNYILLEYSEEYPPIMQNVGMETLFINYYRKKDEKDQTMPKREDGMPFILENVDASPFFGFGDCYPGEIVQAIKNNLFIAPVFKNTCNHDDFLLIRRRIKNFNYIHYIREIPRIYIVGQSYPLQEVQPPHSRKTKSIVRARLTVAAMRRFKRKGANSRYSVDKIVNTYHRYHEQSIRKHFKDICELQKNSKGKLFLALRPGIRIPSEQELLKMCTPEMVCMFETTRVGQQRLADAGYAASEMNDEEENKNEEESKLDEEIQLAPWNTTKNFLLAAQNKGMVKLYGSGDPTGRGEGFSFFRASMKLMFMREGASAEEEKAYFESQLKTGHKFALADQRKFYQEEIDRIWNAQKSSLLCLDDHEDWDEELLLNQHSKNLRQQNSRNSIRMEDELSETDAADYNSIIQMVNSPVTVAGSQIDIYADTASVTSSTTAAMEEKRRAKKALLIKRRLKDGTVQEELVMDPAVIVAYKRRKLLINATAGTKYEISVDDDEITMRNNAAAAIRSHRRLHGAIKYKDQPKPQVMRDGTVRMGNAKRKCTSCGQVGHISTNSICQDFAKNYPEKFKKKSVGLVHTKGTKLMIPKVALEHVAEKRKKAMTVKINLKSVESTGGEVTEEKKEGQ